MLSRQEFWSFIKQAAPGDSWSYYTLRAPDRTSRYLSDRTESIGEALGHALGTGLNTSNKPHEYTEYDDIIELLNKQEEVEVIKRNTEKLLTRARIKYRQKKQQQEMGNRAARSPFI